MTSMSVTVSVLERAVGATRCDIERQEFKPETRRGAAEPRRSLPAIALCIKTFEQQAGVHAAESEGVREHDVGRGLTSLIGHIVQIAFGIGMLQVDGRRQQTTVER